MRVVKALPDFDQHVHFFIDVLEIKLTNASPHMCGYLIGVVRSGLIVRIFK
jgi:hypothetical protein